MDDHRVHLRPPLWLPLLVALVAGGSYIVGKYVETRHMDQFSITIQGEGKVKAVPDIASLSFGVQAGRHKTADKAMKVLADNMLEVIAAVKRVGIDAKDIRTENLSLHPAYDWQDGKRVDQGFEANQSVRIKVRNLEHISDVIDAAVSAGANQAGGISFTIDDTDNLQSEAREKAISDAQRKAVELAHDLGIQLGEISGFWEEQGYGGPQPYFERAVSLDAVGVGGGPPVPAGEQEVVVRVSITYKVTQAMHSKEDAKTLKKKMPKATEEKREKDVEK